MTFLFLAACGAESAETGSSAAANQGEDTATGSGTTPTITAIEMIWSDAGEAGIVMYARATVSDPDGDILGGLAMFDVATGSEQPMGFTYPIADCAEMSDACWTDPDLVIEIPDVVTANDYTVKLVVIDAAGNASEPMTGALAGG